ncbi:hypothetical protein J8J14_23520 [Roseomonas sp. SSH11]|uniref:Uncharacterized protein n=1 Tax=Pararoseomonas baculiformis TaxID=2820812 RepID=A0ABS4AL27_9PROT|nr:hypothetical protein [Pararoseomonas baculiformis]MBP0447725.1 hypothetical protein [Pararoseomonas baculiformis]
MPGDVCTTRVGRYVILIDVDGRTHAIAPTSVGAICEEDGQSILLLPGGKVVIIEADVIRTARILSGEG